MTSALIAKLERFTKLSRQDKAMIGRFSAERVRHFGSHEDIIREGDPPTDVNLMISGWACRYKHLEDGRRQIVAFCLPGDLCDHNIFILREMDHSIASLTPVVVASVSRGLFEELMLNHPRITQAVWWGSLVTAAIQREWTVNLGQRSATERVSHLLCEVFLRMESVGLSQGHSCDFPVTQVDLADATGLSAVHVNRTLQDLRNAGLIELRAKTLTIVDMAALKRVALFNTNYLHLGNDGWHLDAIED